MHLSAFPGDSFCFGHCFGTFCLFDWGFFVCLEFFVWFLDFGLKIFFIITLESSIVIPTPEIHNLLWIPSSLRIQVTSGFLDMAKHPTPCQQGCKTPQPEDKWCPLGPAHSIHMRKAITAA